MSEARLPALPKDVGIHFTGEPLEESRLRIAIACGVARQHPDGTPDTSPYEDLAEYARGHWHACSLEEADLVIHALRYRAGPETDRAAEAARAAGLPRDLLPHDGRPEPGPAPLRKDLPHLAPAQPARALRARVPRVHR